MISAKKNVLANIDSEEEGSKKDHHKQKGSTKRKAEEEADNTNTDWDDNSKEFNFRKSSQSESYGWKEYSEPKKRKSFNISLPQIHIKDIFRRKDKREDDYSSATDESTSSQPAPTITLRQILSHRYLIATVISIFVVIFIFAVIYYLPTVNGFISTVVSQINQKPVSITQNTEPEQNNTRAATSGNTTTPAQNKPVAPQVDNTTKPVAVTPTPSKDTTPPRLAGDKPEIIAADTSATLAWKTTEICKSTVKYGPTKTCEFFGPDEPVQKIEHTMFISTLTPDTLYYYSITAVDEAGNSGPIVEGSFRTDYQSNTAPYVGSRAPDFSLTTLDGKQVSLSQYRGRKVILNFWASWCSPCKIELPHLQEIYDKYKDGSDVTVVTVAGSESDENEIRSFISMKGFTFPVLLDSTESTFNRYDLTSIPKTFFLDKNGVIKKVQLGMFTSPGEIEFMLTSY